MGLAFFQRERDQRKNKSRQVEKTIKAEKPEVKKQKTKKA